MRQRSGGFTRLAGAALSLFLAAALPVHGAPTRTDFQLVDQSGKPWSIEQARGKVVVLSFGYTFCPDICPTALATVAAAMTQIGDDAAQVQPIFVSLDPERDTPERLETYVEWFHPRMIGLTGSAEELKRVADSYHVRYRFDREPGASYYTLDHSASLYLLDQQGELVRMLPHGLPPEVLAGAIEQLLHEPEEQARRP